jgi:hypothetical protein
VKPFNLVLGFVPMALFTVLAGPFGIPQAAGAGIVTAVAVGDVAARGGLKPLPAIIVVILLVIGGAASGSWKRRSHTRFDGPNAAESSLAGSGCASRRKRCSVSRASWMSWWRRSLR